MPITNYIWDVASDNVLMEKDDLGNTIASYEQEPGLYGEIISQRRNGQTSYYNFDGQGSTRELTDQNQNVTDAYTYDAFGVEVARTGTTTNPFGFNGAIGYYANSQTDDFSVRARTYGADVGRWLSADPLLFADGINFYQYVSSNPVNSADPSGGYEISVRSGPIFYSPGYEIELNIKPPPDNQLPAMATQVWQVNRVTGLSLKSDCKLDLISAYSVDFFDMFELRRRRQYDQSASLGYNGDYCLVIRSAEKTLGINPKGDERQTPSTITITRGQVNGWLGRLRNPTETWYISYYYVKRENCKCCPLLELLLEQFNVPDGDHLYIAKAFPGYWHS